MYFMVVKKCMQILNAVQNDKLSSYFDRLWTVAAM